MMSMNRLFNIASDILHHSNGHHAPQILVEFEGEKELLPITLKTLGKSHPDRVAQMRNLGELIPPSRGRMISVAIVTTAWATTTTKEDFAAGNIISPGDDPERQETLLITIREVESGNIEQTVSRIYRDRKERFTRVIKGEVLTEGIQDSLMEAFITGYMR